MTPDKRRPAIPTAPPDAPATKAGGRKGAAKDGGASAVRPSEAGRADDEDRAATPSPTPPRGRYPLPVWPD